MKILFSDFDNTIFFVNDETTTQKNIKSIKEFMNSGNQFCLITGRTYTDIKNELIKLDLPYTYLICGDDALIFDNLDYCIQRIKLDKEHAKRAVEILVENGYKPYLEDGYNRTENFDDCIKVSADYITDKNDAERVVELINDELMVYAYASRAHINVNNVKNNKRDAIKNIANLVNIPIENIYVIGDSINDYEMLESYNSAVVKKHNTVLDKLNLKEYETVSDYIEELSKN